MNAKLLEQLKDANVPVRIGRDELDEPDITGLILGAGERLVALAVIGDNLALDGFSILRIEDISLSRWQMPLFRAWRTPQDASLESVRSRLAGALDTWEAVLDAILPEQTILAFHREKIDSDCSYLGHRARREQDIIIADEVTPDARIEGVFCIRLEDLTRIDFGGGYETGLQAVMDA